MEKITEGPSAASSACNYEVIEFGMYFSFVLGCLKSLVLNLGPQANMFSFYFNRYSCSEVLGAPGRRAVRCSSVDSTSE